MDRKIVFLDIDGTLTQPGSNEPPESAVWAIAQARKAGHYVFLCMLSHIILKTKQYVNSLLHSLRDEETEVQSYKLL